MAVARATFSALRAALDGGARRPIDELSRCLAGVTATNPVLRAVTSIDAQGARAAAEAFDTQASASGGVAGVPVFVKDCIDVAGLETSDGVAPPGQRDGAGTQPGESGDGQGPGANAGPAAAADAVVVQRLRDAGAAITAKTNLPAHSMDVQTFNARWGVTGNPYDLAKTAGGSSGGNAAAIAAGLCHLAVGTDLAGSLRIPAAFCGVYSLRPTAGTVPLGGMQPEPNVPELAAESSFGIGPMGSDVAALQAFMGAVLPDAAGGQGGDTPASATVAVTPAFEGVPTDTSLSAFIRDDVTASLTTNSVATSQVDPLSGDLLKRIGKAHATFCGTWMPGMKAPDDKQLEAAVATRDEARAAIDAVLDEYHVWALPVASVQPFSHNYDQSDVDVNGKPVAYWRALISYVLPFTVTGHPVVTMPVGMLGGLPVGVQFVGRRHNDAALLRTCEAIAAGLSPLPAPTAAAV